jgi:hypothetical protein
MFEYAFEGRLQAVRIVRRIGKNGPRFKLLKSNKKPKKGSRAALKPESYPHDYSKKHKNLIDIKIIYL